VRSSMGCRVDRRAEEIDVVYSEERWALFRCLRERALFYMRLLAGCSLRCFVYGSVARGDVSEGSDVDIFVEEGSVSLVESLLPEGEVVGREVVRATPRHALKAVFELCGGVFVHVALEPLSRSEEEFYRFAGCVGLEGVERGVRVPGVDKRFVLIVPMPWGHREVPALGRESYVCKVLEISLSTVLERRRVFEKRIRVGRCGLFFRRKVPPGVSVEVFLRRLGYRVS